MGDLETMAELDGGLELLVLSEGQYCLEKLVLEEALMEHFGLLRKVALEQAYILRHRISTLVLSYLNYLYERKSKRGLDKKSYDLEKH